MAGNLINSNYHQDFGDDVVVRCPSKKGMSCEERDG